MRRIKAHTIKFLAIMLSMMYVLSPLHHEVADILHSISHGIEKPSFILSHNHDYNSNNKHRAYVILSHEHKVIDFIDNVLGNDAQGDSEVPTTKNIKVDKHFYTLKYNLLKFTSKEKHPLSFYYNEILRNGFYIKIKRPPQVS